MKNNSRIGKEENIKIIPNIRNKPKPVAARSKAWVCCRLLARFAGSNPAEGVDICLV
jgi:hypothetical protein